MRLFLKPILAGVLAVSSMTAAMAPAAFADQPRYQRDHDRNDRDHRRDNDRRWDNNRHDGRWNNNWNNNRHFFRGDRFDTRVHYTRVVDYRYYRLPPPRYGQYYVRTDTGDILLLAAATGLVLWALNN